MLRKGTQSFYQWCIQNDKQKYIELWDYDLNDKSPKDVSYTTSEKYYFKCEKSTHESFLKGINNLVHSKDLVCPRCNSFYSWCIDNDMAECIEFWDYDKNDLDIYTISKCTDKKAWFKFSHYSYYYKISYITAEKNSVSPVKKYYNSLGYYLINKYGDDAIEKYWSDKNTKSPFEYDRGSSKKVWFRCTKKSYHDDYQVCCYAFSGSTECRCPMCSSKIIHPKDSFAQFNIDRYGDDWIEKYYCKDNTIDPFKLSVHDNRHKIHIKCMNVDYHDFWITPYGYDSRDYVCHYCNIKGTGGKVHTNDSLGILYPEILEVWSNKNQLSPYEVSPFSHKDIYLKCENNIHDDYVKSPANYVKHRYCGCPKCNSISSYEKMTRNYLESLSYTIHYEYDCNIIATNPKTGYFLPFDNEIEELKLICEVMGEQHYQINYFIIKSAEIKNVSPEEEFQYLKWKDNYKKEYAIIHGFHYLELPYWSFSNCEYIKMIDDKINSIINQNP